MKVRSLTVGYGHRTVIRDMHVNVPAERITCVLGPNGAGKSTLFKAISGLLPITSGSVVVDGVSIERFSSRELARKLAFLPQYPTAPEGLAVADLVARGRHPRQRWLKQWTSDDEEKVARALNLTGAGAFVGKDLDTLSGNQKRRVWISMVLAQDSGIMVFDEPTTHCDLSHQIEILDLMHRLTREAGKTIVLSIPDINLALRYADHLVIIGNGRLVAEGDPAEVITPEILTDTFHLTASVVADPATGGPMIVTTAPKHIRDRLQARADAAEKARKDSGEEQSERLKRATRAYEEAEAAEEAKLAAKEASRAQDAKQARETELEALGEKVKKASAKARQLHAKAAKFDAELEEIPADAPNRAELAAKADTARNDAADADGHTARLQAELAEAKELRDKADTRARTAREEAIKAQAWVDELTHRTDTGTADDTAGETGTRQTEPENPDSDRTGDGSATDTR
ncbi:ATP-binding cassette domain-containing protein [Corynebacterium sp. CCM 8862]|uniref:ATP-binding cassette domain-containing protein n=2 Tax=Corynebacterium mendelii TaxID=2765362 RepID=A0A939DZL9_9CORY|nr:ATP-binding cassette domain-containing protein [Corynebacterium mendelii]